MRRSNDIPARGLVLLPLVARLAACAARPASDATARFATALSAATTSVEAGLAAMAEQERRYRTTETAARYLEPPPGTRRGFTVVLPPRGPTNADVAAGVLQPTFDTLSAYAAELAALSGAEALAPASRATAELRRGC